jgi:UDP-glucose 4-epimerase
MMARSSVHPSVLVTGGAGFIGSNLVDYLLEKNCEITVLDNFTTSIVNQFPENVNVIDGSIEDLETCKKAATNCDIVFHLAAVSRVGLSEDNISLCSSTNIIGTQNMLIASVDNNIKKFVYSGSSSYYGNQKTPHVENMDSQFLNFYSLSKATGEKLCEFFNNKYGLETIILRYFNVYGPRLPKDSPYGLVIGNFLSRKKEGKSLIVHGDGNQRRDFVHVHDVAEANFIAGQSNIKFGIYNIGSGNNHSINDLARMFKTKIEFSGRRPGDSDTTLADIAHARKELGWIPKITLQEGIAKLIDGI